MGGAKGAPSPGGGIAFLLLGSIKSLLSCQATGALQSLFICKISLQQPPDQSRLDAFLLCRKLVFVVQPHKFLQIKFFWLNFQFKVTDTTNSSSVGEGRRTFYV